MHHPLRMWTHKVKVLQCQTVRNIQCARSLMALRLATEECVRHAQTRGPGRSTNVYDSSRRTSWFTDTEYKHQSKRGAAWGNYCWICCIRSFSVSLFSRSGGGRLFKGSERDAQGVYSRQHSAGSCIAPFPRNSRDATGEKKLLQILAFLSLWKSDSNKTNSTINCPPVTNFSI